MLGLKIRERHVALGLLIGTVVCALVPFEPAMPARALDESWSLGVNEAVAHGMGFGRDILFTFGPYASVFTRAYHPATAWLMMLSCVLLAAAYGYALVLVTRDAKRFLPWALVPVFAAVMVSRDALLMSYTLVAGVYLVRTDTVRLRTIAILMAPFGLLPIVKGSFAVLCGLVAIIVAASRFVAKDRRGCAVALGSPAVALVVLWLLAGQPLLAIPGYVITVVRLAAGYGDAMSFPGPELDVALYAVVSIFVIVAILREPGAARPKRFTAGLFAAFLFVAFKSGFVRHDSHALIASACLLFAGIVYAAVLQWRWRWIALAATGALWLYMDSHYETARVWQAENTYASTARGIATRLGLEDPSYPDLYDATMRVLRDGAHLPELAGTSDIYSYYQADLIASDATWNPRPVIQSYAVYDKVLADANREHLLGADAPDNIVFRVQPIDWHLPALEDGASWWALLARYTPDRFDGDALILKRRPGGEPVAHLTPIGESTAKLGWNTPVPKDDTLVFAEIDLHPSLVGKLVGALYKVAPVVIVFKLASGAELGYRFIPSMGRLGFLLSPAVQTTQEMATLYGPRAYLTNRRVESFKITPTGYRWLWDSAIDVKYSRLDLPPSVDPRAYYRFGRPIDATATDAEHCDGVVDQIDDTPAPGEATVGGMVSVSGWVARSKGIPAKRIALALTDKVGTTHLYETTPAKRQDVADYFHDAAMADTGYTATIDVSGLTGRYLLGPAIDDGDHFAICPGRNHAVTIQPVQ